MSGMGVAARAECRDTGTVLPGQPEKGCGFWCAAPDHTGTGQGEAVTPASPLEQSCIVVRLVPWLSCSFPFPG